MYIVFQVLLLGNEYKNAAVCKVLVWLELSPPQKNYVGIMFDTSFNSNIC